MGTNQPNPIESRTDLLVFKHFRKSNLERRNTIYITKQANELMHEHYHYYRTVDVREMFDGFAIAAATYEAYCCENSDIIPIITTSNVETAAEQTGIYTIMEGC